jgi:hypothetical protein
MVKIIQLAEDGTQMAVIELDDFTIEMVYQGIAVMLRAAAPDDAQASSRPEVSKAERQRRQRILTRLSV